MSITHEVVFEGDGEFIDQIAEAAKKDPEVTNALFASSKVNQVLDKQECIQILSVDGDEETEDK